MYSLLNLPVLMRTFGPRTNTHPHQHLTLPLHSGLGVSDRLPGGRDVQEDGVRHARHPETFLAHVLVPHRHQVTHAVLPELLGRLLRSLLVELHGVQVPGGRDGAQDGVGERPAARAWNTQTTG